MHPPHRIGQIETAIAIGLWAISFPLIKIALRDISPLTLIMVRFSLGSLILFVFAYHQNVWRAINRQDIFAMSGLGLVGVTIHQLLQVNGQATSDAGVAALLASTAPAFIVLFGAVFLHEQLSLLQTSGVLLATLGAIVVSTGGLSGRFSQDQLLAPGSLLILVSAMVWAIYSILNRIVSANRPPLVTASAMMSFGVIFCLPIWLYQAGWRELAILPTTSWLNLFIIGILCTGIAHLLYTQALQRTPASNLAAIQNIEPVIAIIAAAILVGEQIHPTLITGGILILAGVFLSERPDLSKRKVK